MKSSQTLSRNLLAGGSFNLMCVVALGALGSHALKAQMSTSEIDYWQTALFYQSIHAFGLILMAFLAQKQPSLVKNWRILGILNALGIVCFSGGLYLLALGFQSLHFVIPMGGLLWLIHWAWLTWILLKNPVS